MKNGYFIGNIPYFQTNPYWKMPELSSVVQVSMMFLTFPDFGVVIIWHFTWWNTWQSLNWGPTALRPEIRVFPAITCEASHDDTSMPQDSLLTQHAAYTIIRLLSPALHHIYLNIYLVGGFNHLQKYVNGNDYPIYYGKIKAMLQATATTIRQTWVEEQILPSYPLVN